MTAENTVRRVLCWAVTDVAAAMPEGDLTDAARLAGPGGEVLRLIGRLAAVTAARLRLGAPLFGDRRPPGTGAAVLAAAIGAFRHGQHARSLLRVIRPPARAADLLAFHGLAEPAARRLPQLGDLLRDVSPLTGVLDRPGPRTAAGCENLLDRLRADPAATPATVVRFAAPPDTPEQFRWRGECLAYIRHEDPEFVLDVYETAFRHYRLEHEIRAREAWRQVLGPLSAEPASPVASWWRALAELEAAVPNRVTERVRDRPDEWFTWRQTGANLYRRLHVSDNT